MTAKLPYTPVKRAVFKPKSLLGLSISLLMWQPQAWADATATVLPQLNEEATPKVGFDTQVDGSTLTVNQSADKVILNWQSFNIGENNAVHFQQVANGIALNRILDQAPSSILGSLTATGSIYLLNPNGVLFGKNSQVHVGNLLVSTQEVDTERFLKSNINTAINDGEAALNAPGQAQGSIDIEKGAHLSTESGGSVLVFAPSITNAGTIRTPDGQTVLAASQDKVYLTSSDQDPDLRGVFVEVGTGGEVNNIGEIVAERGNVTLMGLAVNQDGRVRATSSVDVNGTIRLLARDGAKASATAADLSQEPKRLAFGVDSVSEAPKGKLAISTHTGELTLGANSLTQVSLEQPPQAVLVNEQTVGTAAFKQLQALNDSREIDIHDAAGQAFKGIAVTPAAYSQWSQSHVDSPRRVKVLSAEGYIDQLAADRVLGATAVDASDQLLSKVELYGQQIELAEQARVEAKSGSIRILATDGDAPMYQGSPMGSEASLRVASGVQLDVSGAEVNLGMERNSLEVEVRGNEVRDKPLQRDGVLRGQKIRVDARIGTGMVDIQGSLEKQVKSVAERSAQGGSVQVLSEGTADFDPNSQVNIMGGKVNYASGELVTTGLTKDGKVVDISAADPNQLYEGLKTLSHMEAGYTEVQDAGHFEIQARNVQLEATVLAGQTPGERQLKINDMPDQGTLTINLNHFDATAGESVWLSPLRPEGMDLDRETWLNPLLLNAAGLSQLELFLRGDLTQERGGDIHLADGGRFKAYGQEILLAGNIDIAGGTIDVSSVAPVMHQNIDRVEITRDNPDKYSVHLVQGAHLDTSGNWVNRTSTVNQGKQEISVLDGGSINLSSRGDLILDAGASLSADAGAVLSANNALSTGNGGAIKLRAAFPGEEVAVTLDAKMTAQGFSRNGSLSVELPELQVGKGEPNQTLKAATLLDYDFFAPGGFGRYSFTTNLGGVDILPQRSESFAWQQRNWVMQGNSYATTQSNRSMATLVTTGLLPEYLRKPVNLSFVQKDVKTLDEKSQSSEGYVYLADGVNWQFDPSAAVSFTSLNKMYIGGSLSAPGGSLSFALKPNYPKDYDPSSALWLGDNAWLSVAGTAINSSSDDNLLLGSLIDAGKISFNLSRGRLISEEGSAIDLSAARATFDVLTSNGYQRQTRASNAGTLDLNIADGMLWQSQLITSSYRQLGAKGANLNLSMLPESALRSYNNDEGFPTFNQGIDLYAKREQNLIEGLSFGEAVPTQLMLIDGNNIPTFNRAVLFAEDINNWNLDGLSLNTLSSELKPGDGTSPVKQQFSDISLHASFSLETYSSLRLDAQDVQILNDAEVNVLAPRLVLGESNITPANTDTPTSGGGFIVFEGDEIELAGNLRISGAAETSLVSRGSLIAHGAFDMQARENSAILSSNGNLSLISSVIYPGSLSNITFESTAPDGLIEVAGNGQVAPTVLTAGGSLSFKANQIEISGHIDAPFGKINIEGKDVHLAPTALVNVSGNNQLIPLGFIIGNDLDWQYSLFPQRSDLPKSQITNTPAKQVSIKADSILMDEGSRINLSGGGDILAYQFAPGPTGSADVLATSSLTEGFALLPKGNFAAYDSALQGQAGFAPGSRITLSENPLVPAGDYYLLPSRYALLPGAFWVKPTGQLQAPGSSYTQPDGGITLTGKLGLANTNISDADWRGFTFYASQYDGKTADALAPNSMANYHLRLSDSFFSNKENTAALPHAADAGSLLLDAQNALRLSSAINGEVMAGELGARVDILGEDIHLVSHALPVELQSSGNQLNLLAEDLSKLQVGSTLIGGWRDDAKPNEIHVGARKVTVEENAQINMPSIVLVAKDEVRVKTGAVLNASATAGPPGKSESLSLDQPAAFLRLAGGQAELTSLGSETSKLTLDLGAKLKGQALLASAGVTQLDSTLDLSSGGALSLVGENIQLGGPKPASTGTTSNWLYFADGFFSQLGLKDLSLQARHQMSLADGFSLTASNLNLQAQSIVRSANSLSTSLPTQLKADSLSIQGNLVAAIEDQAEATSESSGTTLIINAQQINLGKANEAGIASQQNFLAVQGFEQVYLQGRDIVGLDKTAISLDGNLDITGTLGTIGQGALAITASGVLATHTGSQAPNPTTTGNDLGGRIDLTADQLELGGVIKIASGQIHLNSEGDLHLLAGAKLDIAGISRTFGERTLSTPGGTLSLTSLGGNVVQDKGAQISFGAQAGQDTGGGVGTLSLSAAHGMLLLNGSIDGRAPGANGGGQVRLDAEDLGDLTSLSALLANTFNPDNTQSQIQLRQRTGDLTLATEASLKARTIDLTADSGAVEIQGKLLTPSDTGQVGLWAKGDLTLGENAQLSAQKLSLTSQIGAITTAATTGLSLGTTAKPGELNLTASEQGLLDSKILARIQGAQLNAELWLREDVTDSGVDMALLQALNAQAEAFLTTNPDMFAALTPGQTPQGGLSLHAELYSPGDMFLAEALDLSSWRLGASTLDDGVAGRAGRLSLRAGGDLNLKASISDGFAADSSAWGSQFTDAEGLPLEALMSGESSHINLVSGADLTSSNNLTTLANKGTDGSLLLADGVMLRTGTGDINLATQGDLVMANTGTAVIYTAGNTTMRNDYQGSDEALPDYGSVHPYSVSEYAFGSLLVSKVYYPESGGDIHIRTGGDIQGSNSHQLVNEWLHRAAGTFVQDQDPVNRAGDEANSITRNITTWGIGFQDFNQGIASLGGGNLNIESGGNINNLSVSAANTGKAVGEGLNNQVQESQSGAVTVHASGDINSARLYAANNQFEVVSLGQMGKSSGELSTVIALGDAPVKLTSTGNMAIEAVFNPTLLSMSYQQFGSNSEAAKESAVSVYYTVENFYSTYGSRSALSLASLNGDVDLLNSQSLKKNSYLNELIDLTVPVSIDLKSPRIPGLNLLPSKLDVTSFQKDIVMTNGLLLSPEVDGQFTLIAGGNLLAVPTSQGSVEINQLDISKNKLGTISSPLTASTELGGVLGKIWDSGGLTWIDNKEAGNGESVFTGDTSNNWIYTETGDIAKYAGGKFIISSAKGLDISAARNVVNASVIFHHQNDSQHSSITAGRDLMFTESRDNSDNLKDDPGNGILVMGPGSLRIQAGRDIALGTSAGVQSVGQGELDKTNPFLQYNPFLPDKAADLFISAGISQVPNYGGVIKHYLSVPAAQSETFIDLLNQANPERVISQLNLILANPVTTLEEAHIYLASLPLWQQQQVALGAIRLPNSAQTPNFSRELLAYVTSPSFDQTALQSALNAQLGLKLDNVHSVQNALAALSITQQHDIALKALGDGKSVLARNFLDSLVLSEIRQGGEAAIRQGLKRNDPEGYERGYAALATLYTGIAKENNPWGGSLAMDNTKIRTSAEADVNLLLPGGNLEVGLESPTLPPDTINQKGVGLVVGSYGDINVAAAGSINVNKSRIFNLGGGDVMLWSSYGDVDAGKGAKTALSVPPPKVQIDPNTGISRLVFPPAVAGSGIQASNPAPSNDPRAATGDGADVMLFAPAGTVDAGDAGISSTGNILVGALEFVGRDNVAGNVTISVASDTSVAMPSGSANAGNDAAQSADKAADNASGEQKEEKRLAYLTIELLGTGKDDEEEDEEEKKRKKQAN